MAAMPIGLAQDPSVDLDRLDEGAASLPVSQAERYRQEFGHFVESSAVAHAFREDFAGVAPGAPSEAQVQTQVSPDELNERFGVPGYLRFNQPTSEYDAAWRASEAYQRQFRDSVLTRSRPNPLFDLGASLAGGMLDPVNLALAAVTGGSGEAALGALGFGEAGDAGAALTRVGRVANVAKALPRTFAAGLIENAPFVAAGGALSTYAGDEYDFGDALRDITTGAVLHTGLHFAGRAVDALRARVDEGPTQGPAEFVPPAGVPDGVHDLPASSRLGAFVKAVDDVADDRPVDIGGYVDRELNPPGLERLDEATALPAIEGFRPLGDDTAVTPRGTEVPVRYGLAELDHLTTSHDDSLQPNPAFPAELQPRDRARAGAQARNYQLESELNAKLLMRETSAAAGAPVVSPDGVVESGNGRTIALRRSAATGSEAYGRYLAELKAQGFDVEGMKAPVLVRMRSEPLSGAARAALAREMNADVTERMGASEQAMADANRLGDVLAQNWDGASLRDRDFTRAFIDRVAPDQQNLFVDKDGRLSPEGERRIRAAVLAKAYGDPRLVGQIFEGEETPTRKLGEALADAAPAWARMRALADRGEIPPELDLTPALTSAMDLVRYAKSEGIPLGELLAERLGQRELFGGEAISPPTEAFLRLFFRDPDFKRPLASEKITWALKDYARQALMVEPGENLFGETPDAGTARQILGSLAQRFARDDAGKIDLRAPGRSANAEPRPVVLDLRELGEPGERAGGGLPPTAGDGAEGAGGEPIAGAPAKRFTAAELIAADPELKALAEDTNRLIAENGLELEAPPPAEDPETLAQALHAAAVCLAEEM